MMEIKKIFEKNIKVEHFTNFINELKAAIHE